MGQPERPYDYVVVPLTNYVGRLSEAASAELQRLRDDAEKQEAISAALSHLMRCIEALQDEERRKVVRLERFIHSGELRPRDEVAAFFEHLGREDLAKDCETLLSELAQSIERDLQGY